MSHLHQKTAFELSQLLQNKEITSVELTQDLIAQKEAVDSNIQAFLNTADAITQAKQIDEKRNAGESLSSLAGIGYALKDNICTKDYKTTCASRMLETFVPPYSATAFEKLEQAGGVFLGKVNLDEFAMGSSTETSYLQKTMNPYDLSRVPGGSSGGSAAAVSVGEAVFALGTDTGGSTRQPASFCGVVGMKPTYGRISRFGVAGFASSLDQVGCITKDVRDSAMVLSAIAGCDEKDATSARQEVPNWIQSCGQEIKGMRIGLPREYLTDCIDSQIKKAVFDLAKKLEGMGAVVSECSLPTTKAAVAAYYVISCAEASSNMGRFDGIRFGYRASEYSNLDEMLCASRGQGFGEQMKSRILFGTYALSAQNFDDYFIKAQKMRTLIREDFDAAFSQFDILLTPTTPTTAWKMGEELGKHMEHASNMCTTPINLAGLPAMSIPCGLDQLGLPMGAQFIGKAFDESSIFKVACAAEQCLPIIRPQI